MKKIILSLLCILTCSIATLTTKTTTTSIAKEYNWNYWSYEFGFGAGYLHATHTMLPVVTEHNQSLDATAAEPKSYSFPFPDFRLGIEKSWRFANNFTATIDLAVMTPAATFGYLISPTTRLYIGTHYSMLLNTGTYSSSHTTTQTTKISPDGTRETTKEISSAVDISTKGPLLGLAPRIGVDHFLSPSTMLRFNLSYDWRTFYNKETKQPIPGNLHWPQLTVGLKKFF